MKTRSFIRRAIIGLLLILAGSLLLGFNMNLIPNEWRCFVFTPKILLIFFGVLFITKRNHTFFGTILLLAATLLYLPMFTSFQIDFSKLFWPIILIIGGVFVITHRHTHKHCEKADWKKEYCKNKKWSRYNNESTFHSHEHWDDSHFEQSESHDNFIEDVLFFSGVEKKIDSKEFEGGKLVSFFGGLKIDLTKAELATGINVLEIIIGFGGCKLIVPSDWNVRVDTVSIFGGFVDKRIIISSQNTDKTLIIKGVAIFGGGEITSI